MMSLSMAGCSLTSKPHRRRHPLCMALSLLSIFNTQIYSSVQIGKFSVIISQKYFYSPVLCSFHLNIFFLGVHLRLSLSIQSHLSTCHVQPAADSPHHRLISEHLTFLSSAHLTELYEALREFVRQKETDTTTQKSGSTQTDEEDPKL